MLVVAFFASCPEQVLQTLLTNSSAPDVLVSWEVPPHHEDAVGWHNGVVGVVYHHPYHMTLHMVDWFGHQYQKVAQDWKELGKQLANRLARLPVMRK